MDGRWTGGGWEVEGWWKVGGKLVDGRDMDAASAVSVITVGIPLEKTRRAKAKTFRHEGFPGDSSA